MKIVYVSGYAEWWGDYPPDVLDADRGRTVGGGEAGMLMTAFGLASRGHEVSIFGPAQPGRYRDVEFRPAREAARCLLDCGDLDAVVAWADPQVLCYARPPARRLLVQQLNDLVFFGDWAAHVDCLVSPSAHHADHMRDLGWRGNRAVVHNGCDLAFWGEPPHPSARPPRVGYWSSPDRGLHHLLRIWGRVREVVPAARLVVGYEIRRLYPFLDLAQWSQGADRIDAARRAVSIAEHDPSIEFVGSVSRTKLRKLQLSCRVMAYPSDGIGYTEGFCVAALEACAAGCLPILRPADAIPSIYAGVALWLPMDTGSPEFDAALVDSIVYGLTEWAAGPPQRSLDDLRAKAAEYSWDRATTEMERAISAAS